MCQPLRITIVVLALSFFPAPHLAAQSAPDAGILAEINSIKAIDNHAHPVIVGAKDPEFDIGDFIPPLAPPVQLRSTNPEFIRAWKHFYDYKYNDMSEPHVRELRETKERIKREKGDAYPSWVLDKLGIETMLANRYSMGPGLTKPRFQWVAYANPLIFPLDNEEAKKSNPQRREDFDTDERWLKKFLADAGMTQLPASLDDYVTRFMIPVLERNKRDGAVAVKFYAAYQRTLDFAPVPEESARRVYADYVGGGTPGAADYKALQDYLFRRIALECGRLGLAVHIHVGAGAGPWFYNSGSSPFLLESVLNDPTLRKTNFVLLHGGLPFAEATRVLLGKPNVYADLSSQGFLTTPRAMSAVIRSWLELRPEKVLFGTDAYAMTTTQGWEEIGWLSATTGRRALAIALTEMMNDGEITRVRASEPARMVLRENALGLYGVTKSAH